MDRARRPSSAAAKAKIASAIRFTGRDGVLKQMQFNGEVVVVTGSGTGIGRSTAEALAELGATIVLVGAHPKQDRRGQGRDRENRRQGRSRSPPTCRRRRTSRGCATSCKAKWGRAKAVVNNAGNNFISPITDLSTEKWRELIAVDLDSVFFMCRAFIPLLLQVEEAVDPQRRLDLRATSAIRRCRSIAPPRAASSR